MTPKLTWGRDFAGLTAYLVDDRKHSVLDLGGASSIGNAAAEMRSIAMQSARVRNPVMHVSFSAAIEDGLLAAACWLSLVDAVEREFGLQGHLRVVVRHHDKDHDHIHVFWCTIHEDTGRTPPRQWFRTRGAPHPELDQSALSAAERASIGEDGVVEGPFSRFALARLMTVCRTFEALHGLRRLRHRQDVAGARRMGETRPERPVDRYREERTGRRSLAGSSDAIRAALDRPSWPEIRRALNVIGVDIEPVIRTPAKGGETYSGLVLVDLADRGNRVPASLFDLPDRRYGLRQIEKRRAAGAPTIEAWWPTRGDQSLIPSEAGRGVSLLRMRYDGLIEHHRRLEAERAELRRRLASKHADEQRRRRRKLMRLRHLRAVRLPVSERRDFYAAFSRGARALVWQALERRQAAERAAIRRRPLPTWDDFIRRHATIASAGDDGRPSPPIAASRLPDTDRLPGDVTSASPRVEDSDQGHPEQADIDLALLIAWRDGLGR